MYFFKKKCGKRRRGKGKTSDPACGEPSESSSSTWTFPASSSPLQHYFLPSFSLSQVQLERPAFSLFPFFLPLPPSLSPSLSPSHFLPFHLLLFPPIPRIVLLRLLPEGLGGRLAPGRHVA